MGPDRRRRARQIFEEAVTLTGTERAGFLARACGDDAPLGYEVERLIAADADAAAGGFLGSPLVAGVPAGPAAPPARVGPYRLLEKIGEGGMGAVYRAQRDDATFDREVAIKFLTPSMVTDDAVRRLRLECQALATLDHPYIAQILDGGTTDDGLPFLVMERVDGESIDRYCAGGERSVQERVALFCKVCEAVQACHQNLVVHCDIKPSNILVTADGTPKLLDFGIAKLLRQSPDERHEPTTIGRRPLTPQYASPEQMRGEAVSTISDVYSLGVLLYALLTGRRPDQTASSIDQARDATDWISPSEAVADSAPALARRLRGDLDHIVRKAMRRQPEARYRSAAQLAEDLDRHLTGLPVLARRGNLRYEARKFLLRHRAPVAAAVFAVTVLVVFGASMALMANRLGHERAKMAEAVGFFREFFEQAGPLVAKGQPLTLREAVDKNAAMIAGGLAGQPEAKVEIATVLGYVYRELGEPQQALEWSRRALDLHEQLTGDDSASYGGGLIQVGAALRELGSYEASEMHIRDGIALLRARRAPDTSALVLGLNNLVSLYCFQGRYAEVVADAERALRLAKEGLGRADLQRLVATANQGLVLRQLGHMDAAAAMYQDALELYRLRFGEPHPHGATLLFNLSLIWRDLGQFGRAEKAMARVDDQVRTMFGSDHIERVRPLVGLAKLAVEQGRIDPALARYREAVAVAIRSEAPPLFVLRPAVDLGELLVESDRCSDGDAALRESLDHLLPHADHYARYAEIERLLGECARRQGRTEEARALMGQSRSRWLARDEPDRGALRRVYAGLINLYEDLGEDSARREAVSALAALQDTPPVASATRPVSP